jgi:dipeptide/tripeptide permease
VPALFLAFDLHRPAVQAMLADLVPAADRVRAFSILYVAINLGFAAASATAGGLARLSYPLLFAAAAWVQLLWCAFVWLCLPESRPAAAEQASGGQGAVLEDRVYMGFLAVVGLITLLPHQAGLALTAWVASQGHSAATYGSLLGLNGLLIVLLQPWAGAPLGRLDPPRTFCAGALLYGLGFWGHGLARSPAEHALAVVLWTLGEVVVTPVISGTSAALAPPALRGRYQGLLGTSFSVAGAAAPLAGGALLAAGQGALLWRGCLALGLGAGLAMLALGPALRRRLSWAADPTGSPP